MAAEDFGAEVNGIDRDFQADHQNKPDIASNRATMDREAGVRRLPMTELRGGACGQELVRGKKNLSRVRRRGTELTGAKCAPTTVHWT